MALGSRRLAIQDLSPAGHMPMASEDGLVQLVYNGELYNAPELRSRLEADGQRFRSTSDTEVLLRLYLAEGLETALSRLNGMFAFAIADFRGQPKLFLGRDHLGIKPLYYWAADGKIAFASELKGLLCLDEIEPKISLPMLDRFMTFLWVPEPATILEGIQKLPAGHYLEYRERVAKVHQYWDLKFPPVEPRRWSDVRALTEETRTRFVSAVKNQMLSDAPIGAFLSSGVDSTSVVAAMAEAGGRFPLRTFTASFSDRDRKGELTADDPQVARRSARRFGAIHEDIRLEPDVVRLLPKLVWHMDDPVADPAMIPAFLICHRASSNVKVLLSGLGGDEVFAGYRKHQASMFAQHYRRLPSTVRSTAEAMLRRLPPASGSSLSGVFRLARKWAASASLPPEEQFVMYSTYLTGTMKGWLFTREFAENLAGSDPAQPYFEAYRRVDQAAWLHQMLNSDMKFFLPSLNLNYTDKMSMAASVEVRVPFLDRTLLEWTAKEIPPQALFRLGRPKQLFKDAMRRDLPVEVASRAKANFGAPIHRWIREDLREMVEELLSPDSVRARGFFNPAAVWKMLDQHISDQRDWGMQIWQLLTLELWCRTFIDRSI